MRDAFIAELHDIAARDSQVLLLSADIGFRVFDRFLEAYPGRYLNMGVAEANMIGTAAGLAMSGKTPFAYTIIPFLTMRAFEQIRVDVCIQNQPVKIVGVGGGLAYDILGPTHHAIEDVAILRALPNMTVILPCDPAETRAATRAAYEHAGPVYVRLGKNGEPPLGASARPFTLGRAIEMRPGGDAAILGAGPILRWGLEAAERLGAEGIDCRVVNLHTVKPIDADAVIEAARATGAIVTLEEHNVIGGLGSAVAEVLAEGGAPARFKRLGVRDRFTYEVGKQAYLFERHGLSVDAIAAAVRALVGAKPAGGGEGRDA